MLEEDVKKKADERTWEDREDERCADVLLWNPKKQQAGDSEGCEIQNILLLKLK